MKALELIKKHRKDFGRVTSLDYNSLPFVILDLVSDNQKLSFYDISKPSSFTEFIKNELMIKKAKFAIGKYDEDRNIYDHSGLFSEEERRTIHLGVDLWVNSGVDVLAPYDGIVHSFNDNKGKGDYGPTIILEHRIKEEVFYSLYGHLSRTFLNTLKKGKIVLRGEKIAEVGTSRVNGGWPPHLHFQIILDILDKKGDYPGVCKYSEKGVWLRLCPNPNIILGIDKL